MRNRLVKGLAAPGLLNLRETIVVELLSSSPFTYKASCGHMAYYEKAKKRCIE